MIENKSIISVSKKERQYQMICNSDSPLNEVYDVLIEMQGEVFELIKKCELQSKLAQDANPPVVDVAPDLAEVINE